MRVLIAGDSFVEGVGATRKNGWAQMLAAASPGHEFVISGVGGDNIRTLLERLRAMPAHAFGLVILQVGLNDSRYRPSLDGHEIPIHEFRRAFHILLALLRHSGSVKLVIVGLTRVDEAKTDPYKDDKHYRNRDIDVFDTELRRLANESGAAFVQPPRLNDDSANLVDGLHPSDKGHQLIFEEVWRHLRAEGIL